MMNVQENEKLKMKNYKNEETPLGEFLFAFKIL